MTRLFKRLRGFAREDQGSIAIETVILIPVLFWAYLAMFSIFDTYRNYSINQKAAYTVGDLISRGTVIDTQYIDGMRDLVQYMTITQARSDVNIRITSIRYDESNDIFDVDWSEARGNFAQLTDADVRNWHNRLPVMANNDRITLVETKVHYVPPFDIGLGPRNIENFVFTKPRYAPRICLVICPAGP